MLVLEHKLDRLYGDCVRKFTDGSADRGLLHRKKKISAASFVIPGMYVSWAAHLDPMTTPKTRSVQRLRRLYKRDKTAPHAVIRVDFSQPYSFCSLAFPQRELANARNVAFRS